MNKKNLIVGIIILVLAVGGMFIASQQSQQTKMADEESVSTDKKEGEAMKDDSEKDDSAMMKDDTRYVEYSKEAFDNSSDKRRVLFFYASWCPICRPADADFKANITKIPEDTVLIRVNFNDPETDQEEKDLAKKYGITYQHTFVQIDADGNEITKWSGGQTDDLLTNIK